MRLRRARKLVLGYSVAIGLALSAGLVGVAAFIAAAGAEQGVPVDPVPPPTTTSVVPPSTVPTSTAAPTSVTSAVPVPKPSTSRPVPV